MMIPELTLNPFELTVIKTDEAFCNRAQEQALLLEYASNGTNVVLQGPRRHGKTSLLKRVQARFEAERGGISIYADLYRVTSVENMAARIARGVFEGLHRHENLLDKGRRWLDALRHFRPVMRPDPLRADGIAITPELVETASGLDRLRTTLEDVERFTRDHGKAICMGLDEFQDIVDLGDKEIEAVMRGVVQDQKNVAYFFAGSRRRVLLDLFQNKGRPFFHSAFILEVAELPAGELADFIGSQFARRGKKCPRKAAEKIVAIVRCAPYYAQALSFHAFSLTHDLCSPDIVQAALVRLLDSEKYGYEAVLQGLTDVQVDILSALASRPTSTPTGKAFLARTGASVGGVQKAMKRLQDLDLVERIPAGKWRLVDPMFAMWLQGR